MAHPPVACAGKATATGSGAGQGYTINIPLAGDSGHDSMLAVWQRVVAPVAHRFKPDLILCSAGKATAVLATADAGLPVGTMLVPAILCMFCGASNCSCSC